MPHGTLICTVEVADNGVQQQLQIVAEMLRERIEDLFEPLGTVEFQRCDIVSTQGNQALEFYVEVYVKAGLLPPREQTRFYRRVERVRVLLERALNRELLPMAHLQDAAYCSVELEATAEELEDFDEDGNPWE